MRRLLNRNIIQKLLGLLVFGVILFSSNRVVAQYDMGVYNLRAVPQANQYNPAFIPDYNIHFGFPALSSVYSGIGTNGAKYNQFFKKMPDDSLHLDFKGVQDAIKDENRISISTRQQWLNFGMKWRKFYFSFSLADVISMNQYYPKNLLNLVVDGNAAFIGETVSLDPLSIKALHYREYAFGAAYKLNDKWNFGIKAKLLYGKSAINSEKMNINLTTSEDYYYLDAETDFRVNTSLPTGKKDTLSPVTFGEYSFSAWNMGVGVDIGATYNLDDKFSFSASVLDLGYIQFDRWIENYYSTSKIHFEGINFNQFEGLEDAQREQKIKEVKDSLFDLFELEDDAKRFIVPLTAKVYLGANYKMSDVDNVGVLFRMAIYKGKFIPSFSMSYFRQLNKNIGVTANYTMANRSYSNIGIGVVATFKPVQIYFSTDNLYGIIFPDDTRYTNFHFGINFIIPGSKVFRPMIEL